MTEDSECKTCHKHYLYICKSGNCIPCERKLIGPEGLELLKTILDLTNEGKYSVPLSIVEAEHESRLSNK